jgi:hypothetical protein
LETKKGVNYKAIFTIFFIYSVWTKPACNGVH